MLPFSPVTFSTLSLLKCCLFYGHLFFPGESISNYSSSSTSSSPLKVVSRASEGDLGDVKETSFEHKSETAVGGPLCTKLELAHMIESLVDYHCSRLGKNFNCSDVHSKHVTVRYV